MVVTTRSTRKSPRLLKLRPGAPLKDKSKKNKKTSNKNTKNRGPMAQGVDDVATFVAQNLPPMANQPVAGAVNPQYLPGIMGAMNFAHHVAVRNNEGFNRNGRRAALSAVHERIQGFLDVVDDALDVMDE